jgi:hypothetical protein
MTRTRLENRRPHDAFTFEHEGFIYHCTASHFPDGRVAELFLSTSKAGSAAQVNAEAAAILASLCLQHGVAADVIRRAVGGPVGLALELAERGHE